MFVYPNLSVSLQSWYFANSVGLAALWIALPIAAYCRFRSSVSIQLGEAMLLISSFCWSVKFVNLAFPCPGSCFGVSWARSNDMVIIGNHWHGDYFGKCRYTIITNNHVQKTLHHWYSLDPKDVVLFQGALNMVLSRRTRGCGTWSHHHLEARHRVDTLDWSTRVTVILRWHGQ